MDFDDKSIYVLFKLIVLYMERFCVPRSIRPIPEDTK